VVTTEFKEVNPEAGEIDPKINKEEVTTPLINQEEVPIPQLWPHPALKVTQVPSHNGELQTTEETLKEEKETFLVQKV
jgi:hypothetical protein